MPDVHYQGGSLDGHTLPHAPAAFARHQQREVSGADPDAPYELYRRRGASDGTVVFVFDSASATRRLTDDQEYPDGA